MVGQIDHTELHDLAARYADAVNRWDVNDLGDCFAPDAVWEVLDVRKGEGRKGVVATIAEARSWYEWLYHFLQGVVVLSQDRDSARMRVYATEHSCGKGVGWLAILLYNDECVRIENRWYFASRTIDILYYGPPDQSGDAKHNPAPTRA